MNAAAPERWTMARLVPWAADYLAGKGVDSPRLDAELLISHVLGLKRIELYTQWDRPISPEELQAFKPLLQRRAAREPLAYILGTKEFYSLPILVGPATLIPRPESEQLVELGLQALGEKSVPARILDLGTGSGCLLAALLKNSAMAQGLGVDLREDTLQVARQNLESLGLGERSRLFSWDLSRDWPEELAGPFDLIVANLPYISEAELAGLSPEIRDHEPRTALSPGSSGLEAFEWVLPRLPGRLAPGSWAFFELGCDQGEHLRKLVEASLPGWFRQIHRDLQGLDRVLALQAPEL